MPLHTSINGKPAAWSQLIWSMWRDVEPVEHPAVRANYFTPRPYRNEYDQGWDEEGFVYSTKTGGADGRGGVYQVVLDKEAT
jgi:hypothetical protein